MAGIGATPFGWDPSQRPTLWGRDLWGWGPSDVGASGTVEIIKDLYRLEVTDKNGQTLARLPNVGSGRFVDWRNRPNQLSFTYPAADDAAANFKFPNKLRLFNRSGTVVEMYHVATKELRSDISGKQVVVVEGESTISQLGRETHEAYSAAPGTKIRQVVIDLLDQFQGAAWAKVYLGTITSDIGNTVLADGIEFRNFTILNALHRLRAIVAGSSILAVDTANKLRWTRPVGSHTGNRLNLGHNMQQISIRTDYRTIATRINGYGAGVDDQRLTTTKDAATQVLYGVIVSVFSDPDIKEQDRLDAVVQNLADRVGEPLQRITADAIDLSLIDDSRFDFSRDTLEPNAPFTLMADGLVSPFITTIQGIARDMFSPAHVELMLTDPAAGAAGKVPGPGISEVWAGNLDAIIMDAIDMLAELLGQRPGEADLNILNQIVQYFVDNPDIVGTFVAYEDSYPVLYHDNATAGVAATARRGDARPDLDPQLSRLFHASDLAGITSQENPTGSPPVIFKQRDEVYLSGPEELRIWFGNDSNHPTAPGTWVLAGGKNKVYQDETIADILALIDGDIIFAEHDFAFTQGAGDSDSEKNLLWKWVGNPSDAETPGDFVAINRRYYEVADQDELDALDPAEILPGSIARQDDDPLFPRIFWEGKWYFLPLMIKATDRLALNDHDDTFRGVLGLTTTPGIKADLYLNVGTAPTNHFSAIYGEQVP